MNFELSDEQRLLQEAARDALSRRPTVAAAREALDGGERLGLWDTAREAGWPGLMIREAHGGAGLGALDAMLVAAECGRVLADASLLGHVPATALLDATAGDRGDVAVDGAYAAAGLVEVQLDPRLPPGMPDLASLGSFM